MAVDKGAGDRFDDGGRRLFNFVTPYKEGRKRECE